MRETYTNENWCEAHYEPFYVFDDNDLKMLNGLLFQHCPQTPLVHSLKSRQHALIVHPTGLLVESRPRPGAGCW